jgi:hypothetical protein
MGHGINDGRPVNRSRSNVTLIISASVPQTLTVQENNKENATNIVGQTKEVHKEVEYYKRDDALVNI